MSEKSRSQSSIQPLNTPEAAPPTLVLRARDVVAQQGDRTALTLIMPDGLQTFTTRQFFEQAARSALALEQAGVQCGDLVVLVLQHGPEVLSAFWGAMLLGAIPSIFPFLTPKLDAQRYYESVRELVALSEVKAVVTYAEMLPALRAHLDGIPTLGAILDAADLIASAAHPLDDLFARAPSQPQDTAFLQHSSGSTGLQKGVMLSHGSVLNQIAAYSAAIRLSPDDVIVSWLPLYHDMGLIAGFVLPIVQGIPLVLMSPFHWVADPQILLRAIQEYRGTICWLPNFAYSFLATRVRRSALDGLDLSSLRALINCSEPVRHESHVAFVERYRPYGLDERALHTCYAMAENTFAVTQSDLDRPLTLDVIDRAALLEQGRAIPATDDAATVTMVSCGVPIPNTEIRVVDAQRQDLSERHIGEIALRSTSMLSGYYRRPDATAEAMADGWYFTGDLGYLADGELYITGRKKDLIIVGGKNIYPQDIEHAINDVPGVHPGRTVAFGVFNESLGTEDIAVVCEVETDDPAARDAITREIRARIATTTDTMARYVHLVEPMWLLKTSSGKIARGANRDKFLAEVLAPPSQTGKEPRA